ncbi:hypothetical protein JJE66_29590 [Bradyrhizobium diazoefficiens]|uniref:type IV pilus modification PilV family protein n=1 Tax=Bradyrhizobium diazoefficiens TaxID=1355477 RepID=UPI001909CF56|nr:hypothetical protein [Bradyrhizobium diazoefficiens]MBK3665373.1 hypothetical protein [Bradyrhizobium diazoefficiens]
MIEIVIAFAILALGIGTILVGIAVALRSDTQAGNSRVMNRIAQSRLEAAGIVSKLVIGHKQGRVGPFIWRETVTPATFEGAQKKGKAAREADSTIIPVWVEIRVSSPDGHEERLSALKLAPRIAP